MNFRCTITLSFIYNENFQAFTSSIFFLVLLFAPFGRGAYQMILVVHFFSPWVELLFPFSGPTHGEKIPTLWTDDGVMVLLLVYWGSSGSKLP